jgi:hypothetical protein
MFFEEYINLKIFCNLSHCGVLPVQSFGSHIRPQPHGLGLIQYQLGQEERSLCGRQSRPQLSRDQPSELNNHEGVVEGSSKPVLPVRAPACLHGKVELLMRRVATKEKSGGWESALESEKEKEF